MSSKLHCIAKKHDGYWSARCLDFTLYAIGDTPEEATEKLEAEINEYLYDAIKGEFKGHTTDLLLRTAPFSDWVLFYLLYGSDRIFNGLDNLVRLKHKLFHIFSFTVQSDPFRHA
jgi:hypothetical protein